MTLRLARAPALVPALALALAAGSRPSDEAAFHPGEHAILTKAFSEDLTLEIDSFDVLVDGQSVQQETPEVQVRSERRFTLSDEYLEVVEGRIAKLLRTLERVAGTTTTAIDEQELEEHTATLASELEEAVVRFEWNEERGEYDRSFEEGGTGRAEDLERLEPEADFLAFLPRKAVEPDDTWEVDASALARVFAPGGDLQLAPDSLGGVPYVNMEMPPMIAACVTSLSESGGGWEGAIKATYSGAKEEDGVRLGRIELEVDAASQVDLSEPYRRAVEELGQDFGFDFSSMRAEWKLTGRGHLLWDLSAGHVHAFLLESEVEVSGRLFWSQPVADREIAIEAIYVLSGPAQVRMALEK